MPKGLFIVIEGIDGSSKSTQAMRLAEWIFSTYKKVNTVVLTHEPTQSKFGQEIYQRLHASNQDPSAVAKERMLELYVLDREQHVDTIIAPALLNHAVVICDRYKYANIAYQSTQGVPVAHVIEENAGFPIPDITLIFNVPVQVSTDRLQKSGKELDGFEKSNFLEKVREQFLKLPSLLPKENIQVINANASIDQVHADVVRAVKPFVEAALK